MFQSHKRYWLLMLALVAVAGTYFLSLTAFAGENSPTEANGASLLVIEETTLMAFSTMPMPEVQQEIPVVVTAYSSTIMETDDTPFITASGAYVADGIIANNLLPFGTRVQLPDLYPDKIFIVEDRMHERKGPFHVDIWFPSREEALVFGSKLSVMEVLE